MEQPQMHWTKLLGAHHPGLAIRSPGETAHREHPVKPDQWLRLEALFWLGLVGRDGEPGVAGGALILACHDGSVVLKSLEPPLDRGKLRLRYVWVGKH